MNSAINEELFTKHYNDLVSEYSNKIANSENKPKKKSKNESKSKKQNDSQSNAIKFDAYMKDLFDNREMWAAYYTHRIFTAGIFF